MFVNAVEESSQRLGKDFDAIIMKASFGAAKSYCGSRNIGKCEYCIPNSTGTLRESSIYLFRSRFFSDAPFDRNKFSITVPHKEHTGRLWVDSSHELSNISENQTACPCRQPLEPDGTYKGTET
ncbi:hypothetical protein FDP41_002145 [Naegleria fowleri]|uniref:Uncharacterized protein n=1 Tax=Naegleria fowleri TaxID=5763 RepID=A0A6A5C0M6_NAEFO|nr:uncharacterized protein FDP41_002145 [Naegleria fowleri]KAF0979075.1 hypothetical protein FDP41_002145 [Naegleria fowleri]